VCDVPRYLCDLPDLRRDVRGDLRGHVFPDLPLHVQRERVRDGPTLPDRAGDPLQHLSLLDGHLLT
jgi:hypothetical protein